MSIKIQLDEDFKEALKTKNESVLSVLRMLRAAIMNKAIELKKKEEGLNEEETLAIIKSEVKKLKDAIAEFEKGGRMDLAEQNEKEIKVLNKYLPPEMSEDEVREAVQRVVTETSAGPSDMGKVMGEVMKEIKGNADGNLVRKIVQEELA